MFRYYNIKVFLSIQRLVLDTEIKKTPTSLELAHMFLVNTNFLRYSSSPYFLINRRKFYVKNAVTVNFVWYRKTENIFSNKLLTLSTNAWYIRQHFVNSTTSFSIAPQQVFYLDLTEVLRRSDLIF